MDLQVIVLIVLVTILSIAFSWEMYKKYKVHRNWRHCHRKTVIRDEANWCAIYKCTNCGWDKTIPLKEDTKEVRHP